jgi:TolA-binding protein
MIKLEAKTLNKNNMNFGHNVQDNTLPENFSAKLAVIASAITTFADALATVSAVLALEESIKSDETDAKNLKIQKNQENQLKQMQKQIDYLTNQISQMNTSRH